MAKITNIGTGVKVTFKVGEDIFDSDADGKLEIGKIEAPIVERNITNIELKEMLRKFATKEDLENLSLSGTVDTSAFIKKEDADKKFLSVEQGNNAYLSQAIYVSEKANLLVTKAELGNYVSKEEAETLRGPEGPQGEQGPKGDQGEPGQDGVSPTVEDVITDPEFTKSVYTKTEADNKFLTQEKADTLYAPKAQETQNEQA